MLSASRRCIHYSPCASAPTWHGCRYVIAHRLSTGRKIADIIYVLANGRVQAEQGSYIEFAGGNGLFAAILAKT